MISSFIVHLFKIEQVMYIERVNYSFDSNISLIESLKKFMQENALTEVETASLLSIQRNRFTRIVNEEGAELELSNAIRIANLLGIKSEDFVKTYLGNVNEQELAVIERAKTSAFVLSNFDIDGLKQDGIIKKKDRIEDISNRLCHFFGYNNILEYGNSFNDVTLFSKSKHLINEDREKKMQRFWLKCAIASFKSLNNPNEYDEGSLIDFLKVIKTYTLDVELGLSKVRHILYSFGITVLVQEYVNRTKAFGVSMIIDGKPCIIITDFGKQYHKVWLTLLHELYHIVNDYEYISRTNIHLSDPENEDIFVSEIDADTFARNIILSPKTLEIASVLINSNFKIKELARRLNIHPTMVYGVYLESLSSEVAALKYPKYRRYLLDSAVAVKDLSFNPSRYETLAESIQQLKKQFNKIA